MPAKTHWTEEPGNEDACQPIRTICAWCGIVMRGGPPHPINHGMCEKCSEKIHAELDKEEKP